MRVLLRGVGLRLPGAERPGGGRTGWLVLPGGARGIGSDDAGGMPVQAGTRTVIPHRGPGISVGGGLLHIAQRHPGIERSGDKSMPQRVRPDGLADAGAAGDPADDPGGAVPVQPPPIRARKTGPSGRSPIARSIARAVRGASGMVTTLPPLPVMVSVRWPRSMPSASMFAPVASNTRSPLRASSEISACSAVVPSPAATSSAPSSLRSRPVAWDS